MRLQLASAILLAALSTAAWTPAPPVNPGEVQSRYVVDPSSQCSNAARQDGNFRVAIRLCDQALAGAGKLDRAGLLVDRGILKFKNGDATAALADFNDSVAADPKLGNAYLNRAVALITLHRDADARPDVDKAIALGAQDNMHVAYYSRAEIEDDAGNYQAAYDDYRQALAIKPDYTPAAIELQRFRTLLRSASNG